VRPIASLAASWRSRRAFRVAAELDGRRWGDALWRSVSPRSLAELQIGVDARIVDVRGADSLRLRLLEMGFVPGTAVRVIKCAPFGDPLELRLRGGHISLRAAEAGWITVDPELGDPP